MTTPRPLPDGTKHDILRLLFKLELSSYALADRLGVSPTAVRQHLDTLGALGLVTRRKALTQPGRPTYLYRLSAEGKRAFPKRYELLLGHLIEVLLERHGPDAVAEVVEAAARRLAERMRGQFDRGDPRLRWERLVDWLEEELAWQADVTAEAGGRRRVVIHHCPFQDVARVHPAVCGVFLTTLVRALYGEAPVEHVPDAAGPACCALVLGPERAAPRSQVAAPS